MKQYRLELNSSHQGRIASIKTDKLRSDIQYHFQIIESGGTPTDNALASFKKMENIRAYPEIFGAIGFPQLASLTIFEGTLYGIIWTTKINLEPQSLQTGVSSTFGSKFGGVYGPQLYDSAVLAKLNGDQPEIIKVYDIIKEPLDGYNVTQDIYKIIYEYAYADVVKLGNPSPLCNSILKGH